MTLETDRNNDNTAPADDAPRSMPVRNRRIVTPEMAEVIDRQVAAEKKAEAFRIEMRRQHSLVDDGSLIGGKLKTLADMYSHALQAIDGDGDAIDYGYLVADVIETMAARLDALGEQARVSLNHCEAGAA